MTQIIDGEYSKPTMQEALLEEWVSVLAHAAHAGALDPGGKRLRILKYKTINGPRAAALELECGMDSERMLTVLSAKSCITAAQFAPFPFTGDMQVFLTGKRIRLECGWPDELAVKKILIDGVNQRPLGPGQWTLGRNERGVDLHPILSDELPHLLIAGDTRGGKTVAVRSMIAQLASHHDDDGLPLDMLVLIDGKYGAGTSLCQNLPGIVGPLATNADIDSARRALQWGRNEMRARYEEQRLNDRRLIVFVDEIRPFADDEACLPLLVQLVEQGGEARVHVVISTQYPDMTTFGGARSLKRQLVGRIALRVDSFDASKVIVGQATPRADWLRGGGDAYFIRPGAADRVQIAMYPDHLIERLSGHRPVLEEWPALDAEAVDDTNSAGYRPVEIAIGLIAARSEAGRGAVMKEIEAAELGSWGSGRTDRLLHHTRETRAALRLRGYDLCETACLPGNNTHSDPSDLQPGSGVSGKKSECDQAGQAGSDEKNRRFAR